MSGQSGIRPLDDRQRHIRGMKVVGFGDQKQLWVLERLEQNPCPAKSSFDEIYSPDKLYALAFDVFCQANKAIYERANIYLRNIWYRR